MLIDTKKPSHLAALVLGGAVALGGGAGAMKLAAEAPPFAPVDVHFLGEPGARRYQIDTASGLKRKRTVLCSIKGEPHVEDLAGSDADASLAAICKAAADGGAAVEKAVAAASAVLGQ